MDKEYAFPQTDEVIPQAPRSHSGKNEGPIMMKIHARHKDAKLRREHGITFDEFCQLRGQI